MTLTNSLGSAGGNEGDGLEGKVGVEARRRAGARAGQVYMGQGSEGEGDGLWLAALRPV